MEMDLLFLKKRLEFLPLEMDYLLETIVHLPLRLNLAYHVE